MVWLLGRHRSLKGLWEALGRSFLTEKLVLFSLPALPPPKLSQPSGHLTAQLPSSKPDPFYRIPHTLAPRGAKHFSICQAQLCPKGSCLLGRFPVESPLLFQVTEDPMGGSLPLWPIQQLKSRVPRAKLRESKYAWVYRWAPNPALLVRCIRFYANIIFF